MFQIVASKENADISAVLALIDVSGTMGAIVGLIIIILLPVLVFCGLGWEVLTKKKKNWILKLNLLTLKTAVHVR